MSWHQGTSSHTMEQRSEETAWKMAWGEFPLRRTALAASEQRAKPVHLGARVVQGRDAEENILMGGGVVDGLHPGGLDQGLVLE